MKKIFTLVALFAAISMNAQTVYDFTNILSEDDYTVSVGTKNTSESSDTKIVYDTPGKTDPDDETEPTPMMSIVVKDYPNVLFEYGNTSGKNKAMAVGLGEGKSYIEFSGKNGVITINNLNIGDPVVLSICAKGSEGSIAATAGAAETDAVVLPAKVSKDSEQAGKDGYDTNGYYEVEMKLTAIASTMKLKETKNGFRVHTITVGTETAVEDINGTAVKAQKIMENGQIYILKNGVKYNLLGAEVK